MKAKEGKGTYFSRWYEANKEKLSAERKAKYNNDAEYRQASLQKAAEWRAKNPRVSRVGVPSKRMSNGVLTEVFRITAAGKMIGRSDQTIRDWEDEGIIPPPTVVSAHRFYTRNQIELMKELADLINLVRYQGLEVLQTAMDSKSSDIHSKWNN